MKPNFTFSRESDVSALSRSPPSSFGTGTKSFDSQKPSVIEALREREGKISTGIGSGVAIPHAFSDLVEDVVVGFGRSREGIDFEALDNAPVHFVILFIVPKKKYQLHLKTLAAIARHFTNRNVRDHLAAAESADEILAILAKRPARSA